MSVLERFRKPGGFIQLLILIESCDSQKRDHLLGLIAAEDPGWAHMVKVKTLTLERVLQWPADILSFILPQLQDVEVAALIQGFRPEVIARCLGYLQPKHRSEISKLLLEFRPTPLEKTSATLRLFQTVRDLESRGEIHFKQFDAALEIDLSIAS